MVFADFVEKRNIDGSYYSENY